MSTTDKRRAALAAALLAAVSLLPACGDESGREGPGTSTGGSVSGVKDGGEPADPDSRVPRPEADFEAEVAVRRDAVRVRYTFTNRTGAEVLVVNRVPDGGGEPAAVGGAYVTGAGDGIVISQRVFAQPDTDRKDWAQAPKVGATRVAAGASIEGELEVPRPFVRSQPYGDDLGYGPIALPDPASDVRFCLGVLPAPYPVPVADQADVAAPVLDHGLQNARAQYLFCSEPTGLGAASAS